MANALTMARRGLGTTAPNPAVGAVIFDPATGEVVGRGWTQPGGRPHAETEALRRAGDRARGSTLYVTLEPCSHHGRTPPCADAVIAAGIARAVVAITDPDPRVAGRGLARMRAAGIAVTAGIRAAEAHWVTLGHIQRVTERRPFVQLKMAVSCDGRVMAGNGTAPVWVTGPQARAHGHLLRAEVDAILVGAGTVRADDPELTCRLPGLETRSPIRAVLTGGQLLMADRRLVTSARQHPTWVFHKPSIDANESATLQAAGCRLFPVTTIAGRLWLPAVLEAMVGEGVTRLLVEGGVEVWRAFFASGLVDEVCLYRAGREYEDRLGTDATTTVRAEAIDPLAIVARYGGRGFAIHDRRTLGTDALFVMRRG